MFDHETTGMLALSESQFGYNCPSCPHGPMLCSSSVPTKFVCSAFRRPNDCKQDATLSLVERFPAEKLLPIPQEDRGYCVDCDSLFIRSDTTLHESRSHECQFNINDQLLSMPSFLIRPLADSKSHAQYLFALDSLNHLYSVLHQLGVLFVLCVGTPRLHEFIHLQRTHRGQAMTSYLLDMDFRLQYFYQQSSHSRYNMVNGYFFTNADQTRFNAFASEVKQSKKPCLIVCDPPFAAPLFLVRAQLQTLGQELGTKENPLCQQVIVYANHTRLDHSSVDKNKQYYGRRRDTIVRIFTNLQPRSVPPPEQLKDEFRFCQPCSRYSLRSNPHCSQCSQCPTRHGEAYEHCLQCGRCRPPNRVHCSQCGQCFSKANKCPHQ